MLRRLIALLTAPLAAAALVTASPPVVSAAPKGGGTAAASGVAWETRVGGEVRESSPAAVDLDGDGVREVVVGAHDGRVWALRADGTVAPHWPQPAGEPINSSVAASDTDRDGRPELFVGSGTAGIPSGALSSFDHDGHRRYRFEAGDRAFPRPAVHATPAVGDLSGDGRPEVSFGTLGLESIWSLSQGGAVRSGFPIYADDTVFSSPALVDVNGDGIDEMVIGSDSSPGGPVDHRGGIVRAITGGGRVLWEFRIDDIVRSSPSVGDIDGDGSPDIVFGAGDYWGGADSVKVFALDRAGRLKPGWPRSTDGVTDPSPTLADLTGDGRLDVAIGTFDSRHGRGSGGSVYAWSGTGTVLPGFPRSSGGGVVIGQITTADLDGDGAQDLIVPTGGAIFAYRGRDGSRILSLGEGRGIGYQSSPLVADLEGDGRIEVIAAGTRAADGAGIVTRFQLDAAARLGSHGWHQFRRDDRRTGSWTQLRAEARAVDDSCPPGRVPEDGFADVPEGSTHEAAVDCIVWWDISQGQGGRYNPSAIVTRGQMASFVARLVERSGGSLPDSPPDAFADDDGTTHEANIDKLAAVDIVGGRADGTYGPNAGVTRAQMATFLVRAYEHRTGRTMGTSRDWFPDDEGSTHERAINRAAEAGFTGGRADGTYRPGAFVTRDQMASFLARVLDLLVEADGAALPG